MKHVLPTLALAASALLAAGSSVAQTHTFHRAMASGGNEVPPNQSTGMSVGEFAIDLPALTMTASVPFSDLLYATTAAHIHCCTSDAFMGTAGIALPFTDFPLGVTSGMYSQTFDLSAESTFEPGFVSANGGTVESARAALLAGITANEAYVNIHTSQFPAGEIRGFLVSAVPEPSAWAMLGLGLAGLGFMTRRRAVDPR